MSDPTECLYKVRKFEVNLTINGSQLAAINDAKFTALLFHSCFII